MHVQNGIGVVRYDIEMDGVQVIRWGDDTRDCWVTREKQDIVFSYKNQCCFTYL